MKFDICVGNPPYGVRTDYTHLKIMKTVLPLCTDKLTFIMPSKPIIQQLDINGVWFKMFKEAVCTDIQTVSKKMFPNITMDNNTAIYYCDRKNKDFEKYCKKLDVEDNLYSSIFDEGRLFIDGFQKYYNKGNKSIKPLIVWDKRNTSSYPKLIKKSHYYLNVSKANGKFGAQWMSAPLKDLGILSHTDELDDLSERHEVVNVVDCPNENYATNLRKLMIDGVVLRFSLWLTQDDRNMQNKVFKYVPAIDYTEIDTDEKLLSKCGFSDDEIMKILNYLKDFDFKTSRNDTIRDYTGEVIKSPVEQKKVESTIYFSATDEENSEVEDTVEPEDSSPSSSVSSKNSFR